MKRVEFALFATLTAFTAAGSWWLATTEPATVVAVELDERAAAYSNPRLTLARIQSDMERVAAGAKPWPKPAGIAGDPLEAIVEAYARTLADDAKGAAMALAKVTAALDSRLAGRAGLIDLWGRLDGPTAGNRDPFIRLAVSLRKVDALLLAEAGGGGSVLRLPCRTVRGRVKALAKVEAKLAGLAGPLLACPVPPGWQADFALLERHVQRPTGFMAVPKPPPPPVRAPDAAGDFPAAALEAYVLAAAAAGGRPDFSAGDALRSAPATFLDQPDPDLAYPYQVWGMASLANRRIALAAKARYEHLVGKLIPYYVATGMAPDDAGRAARIGLFRLVSGTECGGRSPGPSLRSLVMEGAGPEEIAAFTDLDDAPAVIACAGDHLDPLPLVAVANAKALPAVLAHGWDANQRNRAGETALMVAARFDHIDSARVLLAAGARVNAMADDGSTALMGATATASPAMIHLLIEKGADPLQADGFGRRAVDHLLGYAPLPANPTLTAEQRNSLALLLF